MNQFTRMVHFKKEYDATMISSNIVYATEITDTRNHMTSFLHLMHKMEPTHNAWPAAEQHANNHPEDQINCIEEMEQCAQNTEIRIETIVTS